MSRLIVKNLPDGISEEKLRSKFSECGGRLTDVSLKYTKEGKFRKFAFLGFQKAEEAQKALCYFDGSYLGTSKISVQISADYGDLTSKPRSWSKYAKDSSAYQENQSTSFKIETYNSSKSKKKEKEKKEKEKEEKDKYKDDLYFKEFKQIHRQEMSQGSKADSLPIDEIPYVPIEEKKKELKDSVSVSDLSYLASLTQEEKKSKIKEHKDYFTIKMTNCPFKMKKRDVKGFFAPELKPKSIRVPLTIKGIAFVGFLHESERSRALKKNKSFLLGKQILISVYESHKKEFKNKISKTDNFSSSSDESIGESGRLFLRNLSYSVQERDLEELFSSFGPLSELHLPIDSVSRTVKGFAFLSYMMPEHALKAYSALDGTAFQGRLLHILPGKAKEENSTKAETQSSFKENRDKDKKKNSGSSHNWNSLFCGTSAVADVMAENYSVSKREILTDGGGRTGTSAAVRIALGETQIVNETKEFLESQGVDLEAFDSENFIDRSKTVILVKNLPARTHEEEIRNLFAPFGPLGRLVFPPSGTTALVEYIEASEARNAFVKLAYSKFKDGPLYLEYAPEKCFKANSIDFKKPMETVEKSSVVLKDSTEVNTTLFVKNLNFITTEEAFKGFFSSIGPILSATIANKKNPSAPGSFLSLGYGFIVYESQDSVEKALKTLQHGLLDGHSLELKRSSRNEDSNAHVRAKSTPIGKESSNKILIRNIPFEANKKELEDLFSTFGNLNFVRLPIKSDGSHRGFAFAEFNSKEEAIKAFKALVSSTHLYGRRLVLEWASSEESLEDLRKRTADKVSHESRSKKFKKSSILSSLS